jgi:L-ascorbate metabolism protein UlaG (beta-lactamase superfamily)
VDITWLGHACFRLRSDDLVVLTDPYPMTLGLRPETRPATVVTVSSPHPNHSCWQEVAGEPKVFTTPGEYEYSGISVRGVMTPLPLDTPREQRNVAFSIELDGVNICHLGDIALPLTPRQVDELAPVDVLLVPTGGGCTLDLDQVLQIMQDLEPKIVIPMHHGDQGVGVPLQDVEIFLRRMGLSEIQPQPRLAATTSNLPADMKVVLMAPQAKAA